VKIRIMGTEDECREAVARLAAIFDLLSADGPYANRGGSRLVRVYAEVRLDLPARHAPSAAHPASHRELPPGGAR
jgi:hypothetical protein